MAAIFIPKQVLIEGRAIQIDQSSLKTTGGYGETTMRTQVFGRSVTQVPAQDLSTAKSKVVFDMLSLDSDSDNEDVKSLIKLWKQASAGLLIQVIPDGIGKNQNFPNMYLTNDPEVDESPNGVTSMVFEGKPVQLT